MAMSVNPAIEGYLSAVMGHLDPAAMIRPRSTGPIKASGHAVPQQQAVHMTAAGRTLHTREKSLASRGPSTHDRCFDSAPDDERPGSPAKSRFVERAVAASVTAKDGARAS